MNRFLVLLFMLKFSMAISYADNMSPGDLVEEVRITARPMFRDIRVSVKNQSEVDITCQGIVRAWTRRGRNIRFEYDNTIFAGKTSYKVFTMRKADLFGAFASHSIKCYEL